MISDLAHPQNMWYIHAQLLSTLGGNWLSTPGAGRRIMWEGSAVSDRPCTLRLVDLSLDSSNEYGWVTKSQLLTFSLPEKFLVIILSEMLRFT